MFRIYTKPNCPYCDAAKNWLSANDFEFETIDVVENPDALSFLKAEGHKTVPQIYNSNNILLVAGGYEGLKNLGAKAIADIIKNNT